MKMHHFWILAVILFYATTCVNGFTLKILDEGTGFHLKDTGHHEVSIRHFAFRTLCRNEEGYFLFLNATKTKFCNGEESDRFVEKLVTDLCRYRFLVSTQLLLWVKELFDVNNDNHISNFEGHLYTPNN